MSALLSQKTVEKVWGRHDLSAPFPNDKLAKIGEIWFEPAPSYGGVLIKYLFTSEKLSVQVHPSDEQAQRMGVGPRGKGECWLILEAEPGAQVALGLDTEYESDAVRQAAIDGSIEDMLVWHDARAGDFFHVPPGTIHAIGPGLTLLEIQQNTDITFRLYDYGRPRDLHLEEAMQCAQFAPYSSKFRKRIGGSASEQIIDCDAFSASLLQDNHILAAAEPALVIPLQGSVDVGDKKVRAGGCAVAETGDAIRSLVGAQFLIVHDNQIQQS